MQAWSPALSLKKVDAVVEEEAKTCILVLVQKDTDSPWEYPGLPATGKGLMGLT